MRFAAGALVILLAACAVQTITPDTPDSSDSWRLIGKLGIRSPSYNGSVTVDWTNQPNSFVMQLSGALGISAARIEGNRKSVELFLPGEPTARLTIEQLGSYLGFDLPLDHLDFLGSWVSRP